MDLYASGRTCSLLQWRSFLLSLVLCLALLDQGAARLLKEGTGLSKGQVSPFDFEAESQPQGVEHLEFFILGVLANPPMPFAYGSCSVPPRPE